MARTTTRETGKRGIQRERGEQDHQLKPGKRTVFFGGMGIFFRGLVVWMQSDFSCERPWAEDKSKTAFFFSRAPFSSSRFPYEYEWGNEPT